MSCHLIIINITKERRKLFFVCFNLIPLREKNTLVYKGLFKKIISSWDVAHKVNPFKIKRLSNHLKLHSCARRTVNYLDKNSKMVYKIRNKSFFWTKTGWKNNYFPKSFNMPRPSNTESTLAIRCRYDHHSFLRGTQCAHILFSDFS